MKWVLSAYLGALSLTKIFGLLAGADLGWAGLVVSVLELGVATGLLLLHGSHLVWLIRGTAAFFLSLVLVVVLLPSLGEGCGCFGGLLSESPAIRLFAASLGGLLAILASLGGSRDLACGEM